MIRKQTVKPARLSMYEKASINSVSFELAGESFKSLTLETSIGPLTVTLESYAVAFYEPAMRKVYRATVTDTRGQLPDFSKDFDDQYERNQFVSDFETESGRFEVAVSDFEEQSA